MNLSPYLNISKQKRQNPNQVFQKNLFSLPDKSIMSRIVQTVAAEWHSPIILSNIFAVDS